MIQIIPAGSLQANCCIVSGDDRLAAVIDPGGDIPEIEEFLKKKSLKCEGILLTHGHRDHIDGVEQLRKDTGAKVYISKADAYRLDSPADVLLDDGDTVKTAGMEFRMVSTPGHTEGSCCYILWDKVMFSGDTLFYGTIGRTDLPGGDTGMIMKSMNRLRELPYEDLTVIPGHGEITSLKFERKYNPYLK